jgi:hypothetical protein
MSETIVAAVLGFILGQVLSGFVLDPLQDWRKFRGEVAYALIYYANVTMRVEFHNQDDGQEASKRLRDLASQAWQRAFSIPLYGMWAFLRIVPSRKGLQEASSGLIGLSNSLGSESHHLRENYRKEIREALRLEQ